MQKLTFIAFLICSFDKCSVELTNFSKRIHTLSKFLTKIVYNSQFINKTPLLLIFL